MTAGPALECGQEGGWFLAMDTSLKEGSVAVAKGIPGEKMEVLATADLGKDQEHASLLSPTISGLLSGIGIGAEDLDGIVVGSGPGSFTGVRVGAATAKGMAWALSIPLWGFSSLAGAAAAVEEEPLRPRLVLFDARGDRVYAAAYRMAHDTLEILMAPAATTLGEVLDGLIPPGALLMGDGTVRHLDILEGAGNQVMSQPAGWPSGSGLLRLLSFQPAPEPLKDLSRWEPDYLRESGAERMWKTTEGWRGR